MNTRLRGACLTLVALCAFEASVATGWGKGAPPPAASPACEEAITAMKAASARRAAAGRLVTDYEGIACSDLRAYLGRFPDSLQRHAAIRRTCAINYKLNVNFRRMVDEATDAVLNERRVARDAYKSLCGGN